MKCQKAESLFSDLTEGVLPAARAEQVREHLESCSSCERAFDDFERSLSALQGLGSVETSREVRSLILGAVDAAAREESGELDEAFRRAALRAPVGGWARERRTRVLSHAVALLAGAAAVYLLLRILPPSIGANSASTERLADQSSHSTHPEPIVPVIEPAINTPPTVADATPAPEVVIREVIRTVEKRVEVPVMVEVERIVRRGPLIELDTAALASVFTALVEGLNDANRLREEELLASANVGTVDLEPARVENSATLARVEEDRIESENYADRYQNAAVAVRRENDSVSLATRGTLDELVPVLVAWLEDEDAEVVALVERRLESIQHRALADPAIRSQLIEPERPVEPISLVSRLFGGDDQPGPSWKENWNAWWKANGELVAAAEANGFF